MAREQVWTLIALENDRLTYDVHTDLKSLEAAVIAVGDSPFYVIAGEIVQVTIDRSPRITLGDAPEKTTVDKPRRKRRTKAQIEAARLAGEKVPGRKPKANGTHVEEVAQ